jgi:Caspase domain
MTAAAGLNDGRPYGHLRVTRNAWIRRQVHRLLCDFAPIGRPGGSIISSPPSGLPHMANTSFSRMVHILSACLLIAAMRFGAPPLRGQARGTTLETSSTASDETGRYFALVIGIDRYPGPIPLLHTAVKDANAIAEVLREKYGFKTTLLTDASATRAGILDQIAAYETQLGENDNLLIYYAGHGFQIKEADKSFWLPVDATSSQGELGDGREVHLKLAFRRIGKHELNLKSTSSNIFLLEFELWDAWPE